MSNDPRHKIKSILDLEALTPLERVSLSPWLPVLDSAAFSHEEQEILSRVTDWLGESSPGKAIALQTPFASLRAPLSNEQLITTPPRTYWPVSPEHPPTAAPPDVSSALSDWQSAFFRLPSLNSLSSTRRYTTLMGLAQSYLRCLAADAAQPDLPLLEQKRLAGACAACLWHARADNAEENQLALLVADLSGIQDYLFAISEIGTGGVARALRSRSFYLSQISALFAWRLLDTLGLPPGNLLLDSGGKFYLLFAPTPAAQETLETAQQEADNWCLAALHGELALNVAYTCFHPESLREGRFGAIWQEANRILAQKKQRRLSAALCNEAGWKEAAFLRPNPFEKTDPCRACGRFGRLPGEEKCQFCREDTERGKYLTQATWLAYRQGENPASAASIAAFGWCVEIGRGTPPETAEWLIRLEEDSPAASLPSPSRFLARHVPTEADHITPTRFEAIANRAQGRPYLAYLKADVDRLGERFVYGFRREGEPSRDSPGRIAHLSRTLEAFFGGWLERTVRQEFSDCYIVYSGGDDLAVIGPHDQILALARRLHHAFRRFQGYTTEASTNASDILTLSAGIAFGPFKRPVSVSMQLAEQALEAAKEGTQQVRSTGVFRAGRDSIHLLGQTLSWQEFDGLTALLNDEEGGRFLGLGRELREASAAFLYHLLRYAEMWQRFCEGETEALRYQPLLAYDIGRNIDRRKMPQLHQWAGWLAQVHLHGGEEWKNAMDSLGVLIRLVLLQRKGDESNGEAA